MGQVTLRDRVDLEVGAERDREHPRLRGRAGGPSEDQGSKRDEQCAHGSQDTPDQALYPRSSSARIAASSGARSVSLPSSTRNEVGGFAASRGSSSEHWFTFTPIPSTMRPAVASGSTPAILRPSTMTSFGCETTAPAPIAEATASPATIESSGQRAISTVGRSRT